MRQLLYVSSSTNAVIGDDLANILKTSKHNNAVQKLSGLLWTDGERFLQVLEGESSQLDRTFDRIRADLRHRAIVVLYDRQIPERSFGHWSMALVDDSDAEISTALANASPDIRGSFQGFITARRSARN